MILFFTGTGNSKFVADALADRLHDETLSLNEVIKYNKDKHFQSKKPYVVVVPIYAWRLPGIIEDVLKSTVFMGNKDIYFVPTMGENSGKCDKYLEAICGEIHMEYMGMRGVVMPDNYVVLSKMPDEQKVREVINKAIPQIDEIASLIKERKPIHKTDRTLLAGFMSGFVNKMFKRFGITDKNYVVSDVCVCCGLCEKACPVNNIVLEDGRPVFHGKCIGCFSCIHRCPKEAINIKNKTEKHGRYVCPEYKAEK